MDCYHINVWYNYITSPPLYLPTAGHSTKGLKMNNKLLSIRIATGKVNSLISRLRLEVELHYDAGDHIDDSKIQSLNFEMESTE